MKCLTFILISAALLAAGIWGYVAFMDRGTQPVVITLKLGYSSPLSRQHFEQLVLYATRNPDSEQRVFMDPPPSLSEPERKVWRLDPATFAGFKLQVRDELGILMPWKREVLHTDFDTLLRQGRKADITVGGNTARVSFRIGDHKLGEPDYWRHTLIGGDAFLLEPDAQGTQGRLVMRTLLKKDCTCQFALISPGDYRVELQNSAGAVMLAGPLHIPGDSQLIQNLEAQVERP
ncbi:hypothetical protein [Prosthecobacter sp.]|uniref:hypothetical protein n=1 Tax=Prosthecobacter sp. TaxID=1965333 RepID=UPI00378468E8